MSEQEIWDLSEKVQKMIENRGGRAEVYPYNPIYDIPAVTVSISWGDWKHDHGFVKWLCKEHGGLLISSTVTEEDGSDCYSAEHLFVFCDGFKDQVEEDE